MAYGQKYRGYFIAETGSTREIAIYEDGYTGDVLTIQAYNEPKLEWNGTGKKVAGVVGLLCTFQFLHTSTFNVETLFNANPRHYKAEVIDGSTVLFSGWLQSDLAEDIYAADDRVRVFEVSATDGLGDLADIDFKTPDGSVYKDRESVRAFVQYAFNLTGLGLNTVTSVPLFDSYMSNSANAINQVQIDPKAFIEDEKTVSVREVLDRLCQTFYAWAFQREGKWHFICIDAFLSATPTAYEYLPNGNQVFGTTIYVNRKLINSDGTFESAGQNVPIRTQAQLDNSIVWVEDPAQKTKTRPIKRLEVAYDYGRMKSQINGNFFGQDTTGWVFGGSIDYALVQSEDNIGSYMLRIKGAAKKDDFTTTVPPTSLKTPDHLTTSTAFGYDEKYASTYFEIKKSESVKLEFEYLATEHTDIKIAVVFTYKNYKGTDKTTSNLYDDLSTIDYDGLGSDGKWYGAEKVRGGKQVRHLLVKNVATNASGDAVIKQSWETYSIESADGVPADGWAKVYFFRGCNFNSQNNNADLFIRNISFGSKDADAVNSTTVVIDNPNTEFGDQKAQISIPFGEPVNTLNYSYLSKLNGDKTLEEWQSSGITPPSNIQAMMGAMYLRQHSKYCMVLEGTLRGDTLQMGDSFTMNGFGSTVFVVTNIEGGLKTDTYNVTLMEVVTGAFEPTYYYKTGIKLNQFFGSMFVFGGAILKGFLGNGKNDKDKNARQGVVDSVGGEEISNSISNNEVYKNRYELSAPFDVLTIPIGSHKVDLPNWDDVENAPTNLPSSGHFLVHEGDNDKVIRYVSNETSTFSGITSRTAELVITEDVAESWSYYASSADTYSSGEVAIASKYDKGKATELGYKTLRAEYVKQYAYLDKGLITAPFDVADLSIGSYRFEGNNWNTIDHAPTNLPSSGHFLVWQSNETTKVISYVSDESSTISCVTSRAAELVVIEGVAETWNYYASSDETYNFGEVAIPSKYDKGKATKLGHKTLHADYVRQYAYLNRGKRTGAINFNTSLNHGNTYIEFGAGSIEAPPTTQNIGRLQVEISGCVVTQYWYPDGSNELFFRERSAAKVWGSWYTATAGNVLANDKVQVPTFYKRGVPSGYQYVNVYSADKVDELAEYTAGIGISINNRVVSWTGTAVPFSAISPLNYDPETGVLSLLNFNHNHDDLYAPLSRSLTINGTTNNIVVTGGGQTLGADRTWGIDLATIHASPLSGGSSVQVPGISVDRNGRVTAVSNIAIAFPVETDPIYTASSWYSTTNNSSNWNTAYSWGNYATRNLTVQGTSGRVSVSGGMQSLAADRSWAVDLVAVHAGLSGGSTTQVPQLTVDAYGRTTGLTLASIAFPVTSVNGQTGVVSLTTTNIAEGTNLYWTNARGDARYSPLGHNHDDRYSLLGHAHTWNDISGKPDFGGLYVPLSRALNLTGSSRILVNGGNQTLAADRAWSFDLASIHLGLSGGSSISTPSITVDAYGRVTAMTYSTILFPVTSVNGKTGAVSLSTTDVPEGTNLYWTTARGDARYSLLGHTHTWNDVSGKPDFAGLYAPLSRSLTINGTTNNIVVSGGAQTLGADRVWTVNLAALHANPLTGGSTTQVPQITTDVFGRVTGITNANIAFPAETDPTVPSWVKAITSVQISNWNTAFSWGNHTGLYSLLNHTHTWNDISGKPTTFTPAAHTHPYTEITGISAGTGITYISGVIASTITQYTDLMATAAARAAFTAGTSISISGTGVISYTGAAGLTGSGTLNYVPKFSGASALTNSQIFDNGSGVAIGTTDPGGVRLRVNGAIYADGDGSAVAVYLGSGQAIRSLGNMFFDSPSGVTYFRTSGYAYAMTLSGSNVLMGTTSVVGSRTLQVVGGIRSTGQMQLADYTSSSSFGGTRAGLLGFDSSGNVLTVSNDTFAPLVHNHNGDYYTKSQVDGFLGGKADSGHNHDDRYYTESEINSFLSGKSDVGHTHDDRYYTEGEVNSLLSGKADWGHTHDDRYYTEGELSVSGGGGSVHWNNVSNKPSFLTSESDPWGFDSHWFSVSGSTVTLGIQRRNGSQAFANFNVPSGSESDPKGVDYHTLSLSGLTLEGRIFRRDGTSNYTSVNLRGPFVTNASGYQNNIYSDNNFFGNTMVSGVLEVPSGVRMGGASWLFQNTYNHGATPGISSDTIPVVINGVTRYILLKS